MMLIGLHNGDIDFYLSRSTIVKIIPKVGGGVLVTTLDGKTHHADESLEDVLHLWTYGD